MTMFAEVKRALHDGASRPSPPFVKHCINGTKMVKQKKCSEKSEESGIKELRKSGCVKARMALQKAFFQVSRRT